MSTIGYCLSWLVALLFCWPPVAGAAGFPQQAITIVVGFPAGGGLDIWARTVGKSMSETLGQPVIILNKGGAAGAIGSAYVAQAKPDGYTLMVVQSSLLLAPLAMPVNYKPEDFDYLAGAADQPFCLCTGSNSRFKTFDELKRYDQSHPGELSYGHLGTAHITYLFADATFKALGMTPVAIPYKGDAETIPAVIGGFIDVASTASTFATYAREAKLRPLAIFANKRMTEFPDVPTIKELGVDVDSRWSSFIGFAAPRGVPAEVRAKLEHALEIAIKSSDFASVVAQTSSRVDYRDSKTFTQEAQALERAVQEMIANGASSKPGT